MKKNSVIFLFALCPLVPVSSRLAYAIVMALALCWFYVLGVAFRELVRKLDILTAGPTVELVSLAFSATVFYLVLQWLSPVISISLGLYVFLSAFSYLILYGIDTFTPNSVESIPLVQFVPTMLLFSAVRELLGFGSISIPSPSGLVIISAFPGLASHCIGFWRTTGGAFVLLGILAWTVKFMHRRISTFRRNA